MNRCVTTRHTIIEYTLSICILFTVIVMGHASDTIKCYSCMSAYYHTHWGKLREFYHEPVNFTDACNNDTTHIAVVHCPSICIKIHEQNSVAGMWIHGFIRGCYDHLMTAGFNKSVVIKDSWLEKDICVKYRDRRQLLQFNQVTHPSGPITVCTCYGDHCNGHSESCTSTTHSTQPDRAVILLWAAIFSLLLSSSLQCER